MGHIAAIYQKEDGGLGFLGKNGVPGGFCMFLCGVCREGRIDRELSEYVWRRLKHWAMGHRVTAASPEEMEQLLSELQEELECYGQIRNARGVREEIQWKYLSFLLCTGDLAMVAVRGAGRVLVCHRSWGRSISETFLSGKKAPVRLVMFEPQVGVLLLEQEISATVGWQQVLEPMEIRNEIQLQKRLRELGRHGTAETCSLAYMIYEGE